MSPGPPSSCQECAAWHCHRFLVGAGRRPLQMSPMTDAPFHVLRHSRGQAKDIPDPTRGYVEVAGFAKLVSGVAGWCMLDGGCMLHTRLPAMREHSIVKISHPPSLGDHRPDAAGQRN